MRRPSKGQHQHTKKHYRKAVTHTHPNFTPPRQQSPELAANKRKRQRNIIWFNPPFSKNVQTNIGREFLNLIKKCFPPNHKLRKLFNINNLKLSYSCSPSIIQIIDGHNKTILKQNTPPEEETTPKHCNCREPNNCPLKGQCLVKEGVYQATISTAESTETYVGLTATEYKIIKCHSNTRPKRMTPN